MLAIEKIRADRSVPVTDIVLSPLSFTDVLQWIHDTLYGNTRNVQKSAELHELSALVHQKTEGNPFFTKIFLQTLNDENLLSLSEDAERWQWDTHKIQSQRATDNVINLTIHRIDQFPVETKNLLKWACCFGGSVHLTKLVSVLEESITQLKDKLFPALNYGLASIANSELHFAHDRVTEALYMMSTKKERQQMHYTIGQKLIVHKDGVMNEFLEAVDHLNKGIQVISDDNEQCEKYLQLAHYNLQAALAAKKTVAHSATLNYLQVGVECFQASSPTAWEDQHDLGFALHKELATAYSVLAEYEQSSNTVNKLITHSQNRKEISESYIIRANQYTVQGRILEAYDTAALGLEPFGIKFSSSEPKQERDKRFMEAKQKVQDKMKDLEYDQGTLAKMGTLPPQDEEFSILCNLLMVELPIAYLGMPELLPLTVMVTLNVLLDRQLGPESSMPLIFCAVVLIGMGEYEAAYVYSDLALHIANDIFPEAYSPRSKALHVYTALIHHTREHVHSCENMSRESRRLGVECGEYAFAGYSLTYFVPQLFFTGGSITSAQHELENCCKFVNQTKHEIGKTITVTLQMILDMLQGKRVPNFHEHVESLRQNQQYFAVVHANVFKLVVDYVLDYEYDHASSAVEYAYKRFNQIKQIRKELTFVSFLYCVPFFHFFSALFELRLLILLKRHAVQDPIREQITSALEEDVKKLETVSKQTPINYLNKYLLIQAEIAVLEERNWEALTLYSQAIQESKNQGFMHECAIANERALQFTLYSGKRKLAKGYFKSALRRYRMWGATLKVEQFVQQYPDLLVKHVDGSAQVNKPHSSTASYPLAMFDLDSILRASQIISSAIDMDELLLNIMKVIMETAGASKGALIIDEIVVAEYINSAALCSKPLEQWGDGCQAIVEFVSRTFDSIVLGDASKDKKYGFIETNPYIISNDVRSILCMPVIRQNKLKAVLYVENNLMCDVFTSERINVLNVLATQMAISIENSQSFNTKINAMEELAEVQRVRAQEADLYRLKQEEFIDRICHEIRNPIQGIMGNINMMGIELEQVSGYEKVVNNMKSYAEAVSLCAAHQKVITDDVLTLSKLEFGQVTLQPKPFTLNQLCEYVFQMFAVEASKKNLTLVKHIPDGSRVLIGDANRIGQILINLLSNAIKFTKHGSIAFESSQDFISKNTIRIEMCVKDTGEGIDERYIKNLFNRFEQITQRTSEYGGSGLGLFISKNLAKLMHGDISCQSVRGQGSTFTFHVECEYDESVTIETKQEEEVATNNLGDRVLRVLVVEDNKINRRVLQRIIKHTGCECITANDGVDGLEQYKNNELDIVFMDVSMPNMDGYECSQRIREWEVEKGLKVVPIIGLSGNVRQEYHKQGIDSGMSAYLNKPISKNDIMEQLRKL
jgi:signal transduction histidine kinase/predicted ATPase/CheY-like chemotaxis protein